MKLLALLVVATVSLASAFPQVGDDSNADHILKPLDGKTGAEKMVVLIPGANVPTENYLQTAAAMQNGTDLKLWVAIPTMGPPKRCIILCPTLSACAPLHSFVTSILSKAADAGFKGSTSAPDTFIAGHSLGGICASRLALSYTNPPYQGAIVMGSYAEAKSGAGSEEEFPVPILTVGAELDGGLGRPAMIGVRLAGSDTAAANTTSGPRGLAWQMKEKPVVIMPKMDHSSFCPGFQVPGDVYPPEATQEEAMTMVSESVGAFLALNTDQSSDKQAAAVSTLTEKLAWTRKLLAPLEEAYKWEAGNNGGNHTYAPLCPVAQKMLAGSAADGKVDVVGSVYKDDSHQFEHTRTGYAVEADGHLAVNVSGHNDYYSGISTGCLVPASNIACKMTAAERIAQQLKLTGNSSPNCSDVNKYVVQLAEQILSQTEAGNNTLARFKAKGRGIMFGDDFSPFGNIGPLFVKGSIKIEDSSKGITISSIAIKNGIDSAIFPGVHYCKFVSPARIIDYMMIDSLKKKSGCLNA